MGMLAIAQVLVVEADVCLWCHQPTALFDDGALERCAFPNVPYDLLEIVVVEDATHDVLGPRLRPSLEENHLEARFRHRVRRRGPGRPGADHDRVELLL